MAAGAVKWCRGYSSFRYYLFVPLVVLLVVDVAMGDDGYSPSVWDSADHSDTSNPGHAPYGLTHPGNLPLLYESATTPAFTFVPGKPSSPPPRSSSDSLGRSSTSRRRDSMPITVDRKDMLSTIPSDVASLVEPSFDENVLRALCELDVSDAVPDLEHGYMLIPGHGSAVCPSCWIASNRAWYPVGSVVVLLAFAKVWHDTEFDL